MRRGLTIPLLILLIGQTVTVTNTTTVTVIIEKITKIELPLKEIVTWFLIAVAGFLIIRSLWKAVNI